MTEWLQLTCEGATGVDRGCQGLEDLLTLAGRKLDSVRASGINLYKSGRSNRETAIVRTAHRDDPIEGLSALRAARIGVQPPANDNEPPALFFRAPSRPMTRIASRLLLAGLSIVLLFARVFAS